MRLLLTLLPILILIGLLNSAGGVSAQADGSVSILPNPAQAQTAGTVDVDVVLDPGDDEIAVWIVEFTYDPEVVEFISCDTLTIPPGVVGAALCDVKDDGLPPGDETSVSLGGYIENDGGTAHGFDEPMIVTTFTFLAIGAPGEHSDLTITAANILNPNGDELEPVENDGLIQIVPPSPTPSPTPSPSPTLPPQVGGSVEITSSPSTGVVSSLLWLAALPLILAAAYGWRRTASKP